MLAKRIIPCLDVKEGKVVKGKHFLNLKYAGDLAESASYYSREGADELVFLDITASQEERKTRREWVRRVAEEVFIPLTVGGGIRDIDDIALLLRSGADKISINTAAVENPEIIRESAGRFGSQCTVVAIDAKKTPRHKDRRGSAYRRDLAKGGLANYYWRKKSSWEVYTYGGKKPTGMDVIEWAKRVASLGAGELLLTSMDRDGTKEGYDLELTAAVAESVNIPLIASGGAGTLEHLYQALTVGKADAALAASIFHYKEYTIAETKKYLRERGLPVRL